MDGNTVPPVFVKVRDTLTSLSEFSMATAVASQVGDDSVLGCQKVRGLWRVYILNQEARIKLITEQLTIGNQTVPVYGDNPFRAQLDGPEDEITKITIKDFPISYGNDEIERYMQAKGVHVRKIQYAKARNPQTRELSKFYNGDRLLIVDKLTTALPRSEELVGQRIRIFHDGQTVPQRPLLCTKCLGTDHVRSKCPKSDPWCCLCQCDGHKAGEEACEATTAEEAEDVRTIFGHEDPLSNHHLADVRVLGQTFPSAEHAYKHTQAINAKRPDIAKEILQTKYPHTVKRLSKNIPWNPAWDGKKEHIMERILQSKMEQNEDFRKALQESGDKVLVGAAPGDHFWGSGLSAKHTMHTKPEKWPGLNKLGKLLHNLRTRLSEESTPTPRILRSTAQAFST